MMPSDKYEVEILTTLLFIYCLQMYLLRTYYSGYIYNPWVERYLFLYIIYGIIKGLLKRNNYI